MRGILDRDRDATSQEEIEWVIDSMVRYGAIEKAQRACQTRAESAEARLAQLPPSESREVLREMCSFLVERVF